ncbi:Gaa1-like protein [Peziza echinospora]|nr:Gaa1-like protein [Peziza echinospora]
MALQKKLSAVRFATLLPYLSAICAIVGIGWILALPRDDNVRRTHVSENALLPGQVHTYFAGSEHDVFRAYRAEVTALVNATDSEKADVLAGIFTNAGLKVARQKYTYEAAGEVFEGENVYAILQAPRGDATEAMVLCAAWESNEGVLNEGGVALVMSLARYFKRWSVWSKDIIFLITSDVQAGPNAWLTAYHSPHPPPTISPLTLKSGMIQGAVAIDYPEPGRRFDAFHLIYDGINGNLPNLDLVTTTHQIAQYHIGIRTLIQSLDDHRDDYRDRLRTMLRGMAKQAIGLSTGVHSAFIPYHINAVTVQPWGDGWHDEGSLGRLVESAFRSINNLLESFHQSYFFYILLERMRYVSIGTYLPGGMALAAVFSLLGMKGWIDRNTASTPTAPTPAQTLAAASEKKKTLVIPRPQHLKGLSPALPSLTSPLLLLFTIHLLSLVPLTLFLNNPSPSLLLTFSLTSSVILSPLIAPFLISQQTTKSLRPLSLLTLGTFLAALATLNFSLAAAIGVACLPLTIIPSTRPKSVFGKVARWVLHQLVSPMVVIPAAGVVYTIVMKDGEREWMEGLKGVSLESVEGVVREALRMAAVGWWVEGGWTPLMVWGVWWPAWVISGL